MRNIFVVILIFSSFLVEAQKLRVTFINPSVPGVAFWDRVVVIAKAAAKDLDIELTIVHGEDNRITHFSALKSISLAETPPDFVIFMPYGGNAKVAFETLNQAKIPFITIEHTLHLKEKQEIGRPQQIYKYWKAEVFHDNLAAGKLLADSLINKAKLKKPNKMLKVIGITGNHSGESEDRNQGLIASINAHNNVTLMQNVPANWSRERSQRMIHKLIKRYGVIDVAWTASDSMALGVLDSISSQTNQNKVEMVVGGIDWTREAIENIFQKKIHASVGGHIMQTAWALVKVYDINKGLNDNSLSSGYHLDLIDSSNIENYIILKEDVNWDKVDFLTFTKFHNHRLGKSNDYQFSFAGVLKQLQAKP